MNSLSSKVPFRLGPAIRRSVLHSNQDWVWCSSPIQSPDGSIQRYSSHIPKTYKKFHPAWLFHSHIVRSEATAINGPYSVKEAVFPDTKLSKFDGCSQHNPCIRFHKGTYYLFYMGCRNDNPSLNSDTVDSQSEFYRSVWANKRIGLATSSSPYGPWKRTPQPILEPRPDSWDRIATTNPAPCFLPNGKVIMMYKSKSDPLGPRLLGIATADHPGGSYRAILDTPLFQGHDLEDPVLWYQGESIHAILKDMRGDLGGEEGCLVYAQSQDGINWNLPESCFVHGKKLCWDDGETETVGNFERPQLLFDQNGIPTHLFAAISRPGKQSIDNDDKNYLPWRGIQDAADTFNVALPILPSL